RSSTENRSLCSLDARHPCGRLIDADIGFAYQGAYVRLNNRLNRTLQGVLPMPLVSNRWHWLVGALVLALVSTTGGAAPAPERKSKAEGAAERVRKALDKEIDLDIAEQPLNVAINQLHDLTKANFILEPMPLPNGADANSATVTIKVQNVKA